MGIPQELRTCHQAQQYQWDRSNLQKEKLHFEVLRMISQIKTSMEYVQYTMSKAPRNELF